jgi:hypothetical protein
VRPFGASVPVGKDQTRIGAAAKHRFIDRHRESQGIAVPARRKCAWRVFVGPSVRSTVAHGGIPYNYALERSQLRRSRFALSPRAAQRGRYTED